MQPLRTFLHLGLLSSIPLFSACEKSSPTQPADPDIPVIPVIPGPGEKTRFVSIAWTGSQLVASGLGRLVGVGDNHLVLASP
jgi:hypothetical protein